MTTAEKEEMQRLNERLARHMQQVRENAADASPAVLKALIKDMEDQMARQRAFNEREADKLRRQLEDAERAKNAAESENEAQQREAASYQSRCQDETRKNQKLLDDLERANQKIYALEQEANEARAAARGPQDKIQQLQDDVGKAMSKYETANNELTKERGKCKDLQSQLNNALQKQDYAKRANDEQLKEMQGRLDNAKRLISDLEQQNKALQAKNAQLPAAMDELRRKNAEEMKAYKDQAEYTSNKNLKELQQQYNAMSSLVDRLREENARLQKDNDDLKKWLKAAETRAAELHSQIEALEQQLKAEREKNAKDIRDAEKRQKEMNDLLVSKVQENNTTREAQASLQYEIKRYEELLDGDDNKLGQRGGSSYGLTRVTRKYSGTGGRTGGGGGRTGCVGGSATGSGRNRPSISQGVGGSQKLPLRSWKTEYTENYISKPFGGTGSWDARRTRQCALPRVE